MTWPTLIIFPNNLEVCNICHSWYNTLQLTCVETLNNSLCGNNSWPFKIWAVLGQKKFFCLVNWLVFLCVCVLLIWLCIVVVGFVAVVVWLLLACFFQSLHEVPAMPGSEDCLGTVHGNLDLLFCVWHKSHKDNIYTNSFVTLLITQVNAAFSHGLVHIFSEAGVAHTCSAHTLEQ